MVSKKKNESMQKNFSLSRDFLSPAILLSALIFCAAISMAAESGAPIPPERFSDDFYKVYGTPNLAVSLEQTRVYQGRADLAFSHFDQPGAYNLFSGK